MDGSMDRWMDQRTDGWMVQAMGQETTTSSREDSTTLRTLLLHTVGPVVGVRRVVQCMTSQDP